MTTVVQTQTKRKAKWAERHEVGKPTAFPATAPTLRCVARKGAYAVAVAWPDETYSLIDALIGEVEQKRRPLGDTERLFEYLGPGEIRAEHWVSFGPMQAGRW
jgi:hypothetical protein